ncbi:unnamed protein product [Ambrosiozyma monospora]|uniref:Unnamed protein product n=1 Tax=Ambrosiozyma monospora TaxID=43982 RepID=A0A9W7DDU1_AMBMO|nr:unnamed protein product [Ambrosiozyma monospora]
MNSSDNNDHDFDFNFDSDTDLDSVSHSDSDSNSGSDVESTFSMCYQTPTSTPTPTPMPTPAMTPLVQKFNEKSYDHHHNNNNNNNKNHSNMIHNDSNHRNLYDNISINNQVQDSHKLRKRIVNIAYHIRSPLHWLITHINRIKSNSQFQSHCSGAGAGAGAGARQYSSFTTGFKLNKRTLFTIYFVFISLMVLPSLIYMEKTILSVGSQLAISKLSHLDSLQRLNMDFLSIIVLPKFDDIFTTSTHDQANQDQANQDQANQDANLSRYHNNQAISNVTIKTVKQQQSKLSSSDLFDPRLPAYLWLHKLKTHLLENDGLLDPSFSIPFSWSDWVDLKSKLSLDPQYIMDWKNKIGNQDSEMQYWNTMTDFYEKLDCTTFAELFDVDVDVDLKDGDYEKQCSELTFAEKDQLGMKHFPFGFTAISGAQRRMNKFGRILFGASYLYTSAPIVDRVAFIGAGFNSSVVVLKTEKTKTKTKSNTKTNTAELNKKDGNLNDWLKDTLQLEAKLTGGKVESLYNKGLRIDSLVNEIRSLYSNKNKLLAESEIQFDDSYLMLPDDDVDVLKSVELTEKDFIWDHQQRMSNLENNVKLLQTSLTPDSNSSLIVNRPIEESLDYQILTTIKEDLDVLHANDNKHKKYLQEARLQRTHVGDHYDWRFFNGHDNPQFYRQGIIHRLSRAWLRFCYQSGLTTFVAYGSMLGWVRNGLSLPWDEDVDVVLTLDSMYKLARNHNNSLVVDVSSEDQYGAGIGSYYLDIGPSFFYRRRGEGANAIDGRFIDTFSGVYIDLTAVAWTEEYLKLDVKIDDNLKRIIEPDFKTKSSVHKFSDQEEQQLADQVQFLQDSKQLYHCRNNNAYTLSELSPMIPTFFEGVRTHVPHAYIKLLNRKYPGALQRQTEPGHTFNNYLRLWMKDSDCTAKLTDDKCFTEENLDLFKRTKDYTLRHQRLVALSDEEQRNVELKRSQETKPLRYDTFVVDYAESLNAKLA